MYSLVLGGYTLIEDGKVIMQASPCAVYSGFDIEHVQAVWSQLVNSDHAEKIAMAQIGFNQAVAEAMCELGFMKAYEDAEIDDSTLEVMDRMFQKSIDPELKKKLKHGGRKNKNE